MCKKKKKISEISLLLLLPFGCHWQLEGEAQVHAVHITLFFFTDSANYEKDGEEVYTRSKGEGG